jgi:ABC-type amino acid transport substrate-binding protein
MADKTVKLEIQFNTLLAGVAQLDVSEKHQLWQYLDAELFEDDDELDAQALADIEAAYADYAAGDYLTIQAYRAQRVRKSA